MPIHSFACRALLVSVLAALVAVAPRTGLAGHDGGGHSHGILVLTDHDARDRGATRRERREEFFADREDFFDRRAEWLEHRRAFRDRLRDHRGFPPPGFGRDDRFSRHAYGRIDRYDRHRFGHRRFGHHGHGHFGHPHGHGHGHFRHHGGHPGHHAFRRGFPPGWPRYVPESRERRR